MSCKKTKQRLTVPAVYYWKSNFRPTAFEKKRLDSLQVQVLYIKFFDVARDAFEKKVLPVAKITMTDTAYLHSKKIVPTIFITNEIFYKTDSAQIEKLAVNITSLLNKYLLLYRIKNTDEIQIDCDWTNTTKNSYFRLLRLIRKNNKGKAISVTIRLHQLKYTTSSGIPPADKGLLMCYNMGTLQDMKAKNSIIDPREFSKYSKSINNYPLKLDAGLPLFSWYVLFRNNTYAGLFSDLPDPFLKTLRPVAAGSFEVIQDTLLNGRPLKTGDLLRYENSEYPSILDVEKQLAARLTSQTLRVVLYHCDSVILNKYSLHDLENLYGSLRGD
ncbi:MAG: hypothetical protein QM640_13540 [Niabella sp.]